MFWPMTNEIDVVFGPVREINKTREASPASAETQQDRPTIAPATDIFEREDALILVADVPGADAEHVNVTLEDDTLTIRAQSQERAPEGLTLLYREHRPADYERSFTLVEEVDRERIKATVRNGVLTVELPKSPRAQPRKIDVKAA